MDSQTAAAVFEQPVYEFEALGFVANRKLLNALEAKAPGTDKARAALFCSVEQYLGPLGFVGIEDMYLTEDDGQGNSDIKVFVVVKLKAREDLTPSLGVLPEPLEIALEELEHSLCYIDCSDVVGAENWELANAYEFD